MLKEFNLGTVTGDRYAGQWVVEAFKRHGVTYIHSLRDRSAIYIAALPLLNGGRAQLLDSTRLVNQLVSLQRRTSSSGRQSVDNPKSGADDVANAAMGALVLASDTPVGGNFTSPIVWRKSASYLTSNPSYSGPVSITGEFPR